MASSGKIVVKPTVSGQLLQTDQTMARSDIGRRSWTTQPIDSIGCPPGAKLVDLRALLAERFPSAPIPPQHVLVTGIPSFDQFTSGGLRKSCITELISPNLSAGSASFVAAMIRSAHRDRYFLALIDGTNSFDPQPLGNDVLRHLLWVRCHTTHDAIKSADLVLRDGNFPLVIVDLMLNPANEVRKVPQTSWYRFQRLVESTSTAAVVLTRVNTVSSAELKLVLENKWTLKTCGAEDPTAFLQLRVRRAHRASNPGLNALTG